MSNNWLAFGLTAQEEDRYRTSCLGAYMAQARICMLFTLLPTVGFAINDYLFYGLSGAFYGVAALRLAFLIGTLVLVRWMRTATRYGSYDNAQFLWGISLVGLLLFFAATRPQGFIVHAILAVVVVFVTLLAIPNRFVHQLALSLAILAGETLILAQAFSTMPQATVSVILSLFLAGAVGIALAHKLHVYRRREFLAREREQEARAAAEAELADRKRAEEVLQESDRRYHSLFTGMTEGFAIHEIITDAAGTPIDYRYLDINPAFERLTGHKRENVIGRTVKEIMPGTDAHWIRMFGQVALTGQAARFENYSTPLARHYEVFAYQPAPRQFAVFFSDITERKRAEETLRKRAEDALRMSEQEFHTLAEAMPQIAWATRADGWNIYFNQQWVDYTGMTMEESYGHGWNKPFHPDDKQRAWEAWQRATKYNEPYSLECRLRRADGAYRWWLIRGAPMLGTNGEILKWFGTCTDIEEIKRAEKTLQGANDLLEQRVAERTEALAESERRERERAEELAVLFESVPVPVFIARDPECLHMTGNRMADEILRISHGKELSMSGPEENRPSHFRPFKDGRELRLNELPAQRSARGEHVKDFEFTLAFGDGVVRHVLGYGTPLLDEQGRPRGTVASLVDITARKQAEEALRESDFRLQVALKAGDLGWHDYTVATGEILWDRNCREMWGIGPDDPVDIDVFWAGIHPDSVAETKEKLEAAVDPAGDGRFDADYLVRPLDGSPHRWVHATGQTIFAGDGANRHPVHVIGTVEDITDRKRAEDALEATVRDLERSNRELEQFAYIASHDLQEPLRQVRAFVGMLKDRHSEKFEGQAQQYFQFVYEGAARMSDLIQGLLAYSRAGAKDAAKRPVSCQKALDTALANLQAGIAESRARVTHDDLPTVLAQPTQLSQLFQNLIGNAVKFRRDGLDPQIHVGCQRDDGHWLFRVTDNGIGIEPEFHEKVFLIFQRLHGRGKYPGTGIGLAICKKIVEQHGGKIWIESKPDEGSTFCFTLPEDRRA